MNEIPLVYSTNYQVTLCKDHDDEIQSYHFFEQSLTLSLSPAYLFIISSIFETAVNGLAYL